MITRLRAVHMMQLSHIYLYPWITKCIYCGILGSHIIPCLLNIVSGNYRVVSDIRELSNCLKDESMRSSIVTYSHHDKVHYNSTIELISNLRKNIIVNSTNIILLTSWTTPNSFLYSVNCLNTHQIN